ncbi:acyl-CoA dehydrogenase family protein [Labrenzia sp. PHM005]|uniref:acyl-CoA dehydrogenase family protein n=1 Tax=Labrenzia sp. PHM005 TaxID=2590016 RepID=UPI00113FC80A|nr:acyl-CoA dehydrogenase family protein [Labrenzia sp. PHM005]QDG78854.1 pimeloyl-CoA dehydrogenase large subunit [Labrenzia sp. PHM005]
MDLQFSDKDLAFQEEVRSFLKENLPANLLDRSDRGLHPLKDEIVAWQKVLHEKGWVAPNWPVEHGGPGWSLTQKYIYNREYFLSGAPQTIAFGLNMVGPVIYTFGTEEQKADYLQDILESNVWWCQGYSEPGSGSDLASLRTRAVRDGDDYIINGQKIWTSWAQHADMMFCLVRTDTECKPQEGISFILIDMKTPGIEVRPIIGLDKEHSLNEVFFTDVRVPARNLIGEENRGWTYAKFLLGNERHIIARVARSQYQLARLKEIARTERRGAGYLIDDADFRRRIAKVEVDLIALEAMELRYLSQEIAGRKLTAEPSVLKINGAEIAQLIKTLTIEALGSHGMAYEPDPVFQRRNDRPIGPDYLHGAMADHLYQRAATIYGGTNEIQRNIIAKLILG